MLSEAVLVKCPMPNNNSIKAKKHLPITDITLKKAIGFVLPSSLTYMKLNIKKPPESASTLFRFVQYFSFSKPCTDKNAGKWPTKNNIKKTAAIMSEMVAVFLLIIIKIPLPVNTTPVA